MIHIVDFYENNNEPLPHYATVIKEKDYVLVKTMDRMIWNKQNLDLVKPEEKLLIKWDCVLKCSQDGNRRWHTCCKDVVAKMSNRCR